MPKFCHARAPADPAEAAQIRKLAQSRHAPHDCKQRAQMITLSWEGLHTGEIACHLRCHPQTVRERFERFQTEGIDGLTTNRPGAGRKARLTELERSKLIALVAQTPPGRPVRQTDGQLAADHPTEPTQWSLDALVRAAHQQGIAIKRSQLRRILLKEGVRWRQVRSWIVSKDPNFVPKGRRSSRPTPSRSPTRRPCAWTNWGR
jgi:transposase